MLRCPSCTQKLSFIGLAIQFIFKKSKCISCQQVFKISFDFENISFSKNYDIALLTLAIAIFVESSLIWILALFFGGFVVLGRALVLLPENC